jgi:hypothetical protein
LKRGAPSSRSKVQSQNPKSEFNAEIGHPRKLFLQPRHFILTGVPMPGNVKALVTAEMGTRLRFSDAFRSSFVSVLPHFGQRAEKIFNFDARFCFALDARMTVNDSLNAFCAH